MVILRLCPAHLGNSPTDSKPTAIVSRCGKHLMLAVQIRWTSHFKMAGIARVPIPLSKMIIVKCWMLGCIHTWMYLKDHARPRLNQNRSSEGPADDCHVPGWISVQNLVPKILSDKDSTTSARKRIRSRHLIQDK